MGNVSYRFFILLFSSSFWIFIFANLCTWSGFNQFGFLGFDGIHQSTESYFGFYSFWNMIKVTTAMDQANIDVSDDLWGHLGDFTFKGIWFFLTRTINYVAFNLPQAIERFQLLVEGLVNGFQTASFNDDLLNNIVAFFNVYYENFHLLWNAMVEVLKVVFSWLFALLYSFLLVVHTIGYAVCILYAFSNGIAGTFNSRPISNNYSVWEDVADGWQSQWNNLTALL